ncbi:tRNA uracil 4-sulfurtransferase ThiI [Anaerotruncus colihominis]|uniref:Probable tRNA sulfurtransferase n=1 Tax=Anaerotruncus colihominis TaxID=169435 RepID=A0A845SUL8_9FIRM|nr:tRNA uracil 4-sulfurtransferase ThiI [Anaerotruncus colihominis]MCR2026984.1 tRNA 4-thiouridine(8) synthase ThiI [Anaerotruncus colihominis]NDO38002.1 tRNA 4-thiouridine(8) synthase ThiI [Anaerotruncus colihominis]
MKELILLKCGELALKGLNRHTFEDVLVKNCRRRIESLGTFEFYKAQSTIYIEPRGADADLDGAVERLTRVFGVAALTRSAVVEKNFDAIRAQAPGYLAGALETANTFKVEAKRSDKSFPMKSPELCTELGAVLLEAFPHLTVDVHQPDITVYVEIRERGAYLHTDQIRGAGGLPVGTSGRAMLLISGGIDSPVAGYMMGKRGLEIAAVHFVSPPYTSAHALEKVRTLCKKMAAWCGRVRLFVVPFTETQLAIRDRCPEDVFTIIMRRCMMKIAERLARENGCGALITGESVAQVASQTLDAIACTDAACTMPVLRPVIGMDKDEIVKTAYKIDTFETSILPYEDCCTVFTPKHPKTKPRLDYVLEAEEKLDGGALLESAFEGTTSEWIE